MYTLHGHVFLMFLNLNIQASVTVQVVTVGNPEDRSSCVAAHIVVYNVLSYCCILFHMENMNYEIY